MFRASKYFLFFCVMIAGWMAGAAEFKMAVIDMEKVFQSYVRTKTVDATLKQQSEVYKSWITKRNETRQKLEEQFKVLRDSVQNIALSESERESKRFEAQKKYRELMEVKAEIEQYTQEKGKQLKEMEAKQREEIIGDISREVRRRATLEGYQLVLDKSGKTWNGIPTVVYSQSSMDITEVVLRELNRSAGK